MHRPTWSASAAFAARRLRRGWASGELLILALALTVAVAASAAVGLFTERLRAALANQTGAAVGADAIVRGRDALPPELAAHYRALGLQVTSSVSFPSVALAGDDTALVSVKALGPSYPLRGVMRVSDVPFGEVRVAGTRPTADEAWADQRLWQALGLKRGAEIQLGESRYRVTQVLQDEPDRGAGFSDLAPRVLIGDEGLAATGLVGPGSRASYHLWLAGTPEQIELAQSVPLPDTARLVTPQEARPELEQALARAGQFLDVAVLAAALLAAAAVALAAQQHGTKLRDEAALLKCLGADGGFVGRALLFNLLLVGLIAGLAGSALGWLGQGVIGALLGGLMQIDLPPPSLAPLFSAFGLGLLMLLGFAAPPVLQARRTPPLRVFQRRVAAGGTRATPLVAGLSVIGLLWMQTGDPDLAWRVIVGALAACALLALFAWLLVLALGPLRRAGGTALRFGLGNVARRRGATVAQVVALGLSLLALLLVTVVRSDLLLAWQNKLPANTPNQFLINIQAGQVEPLRAFFAQRGYADLTLWPMTRARLTAINGSAVTPETFADPETQRWINREFNLSWTDTLNDDNRIIAGQWWGAAGQGQPWLSADDYAMERLGLKLGDTLTLDFAGQSVTLTVKSFRTVGWDSFRPNFFLLTPPGVLEQVPAQWLTSFHLPPEKRGLLRELIGEFPNITALDIEAAMNEVRGVVERIVRAVELLFAFTLAAGLTVLLAAIEGTRDERVRETGLLRALGASRRVIALGLLAEYATLGLLAGVVASGCAQGVAWVLATQVLQMPYGFSPMVWLAGSLAGALLVTALGWLSLRRVLNTSPRVVLASG